MGYARALGQGRRLVILRGRRQGGQCRVWDANLYEWTQEAIEKGYRGLLTEEFRILKLAKDGYITGPNGAPFGSAGPVIVCGVAARLN